MSDKLPLRVRRDAHAARPSERRRPAEAPQQPVRVIDAATCTILAVPTPPFDAQSGATRSLLGLSRELASAVDGLLAVIEWRAGEFDWGAAGVDRVVPLDIAVAGSYLPEAWAEIAVAAGNTLEARHIVFAEGDAGGSDLARRVAARLGVTPAVNVIRLARDRIVCAAGRADREIEMEPPRVLACITSAATAGPLRRHEARYISALHAEVQPAVIEDRGLRPMDPQTVPLGESPFILAAGNGVIDWAAFDRLAKLLGATRAGTRAVCAMPAICHVTARSAFRERWSSLPAISHSASPARYSTYRECLANASSPSTSTHTRRS
jgi:electron transfer flavoprotein alpha subunit